LYNCLKKNRVAHLAVGVADASGKPITTGTGPCAYGLHLGRGRIFKSSTGHKIGSGKALHAKTPRQVKELADKGPMSVIVLVDMDRGRLAFAVGGGGAIDSGLRLPATARPWVWLGGPGVGTVSVFDCTYTVAQPPPPEPAVAPPVVLDLAAVEESDITSATASKHTRSGPTGADVLDEPGLTLDLNAVEDGALTPARSETTDSDKQTSFSSEAEPIPWTDRAGNWLSGLQQAMGLLSPVREAPSNADGAVSA